MRSRGRSAGKGAGEGSASFGSSTGSSASGFTLVELLVVVSIMAIVFLTAYSALSVGVKVWKRVESSVHELDLTLGWKKLRKDLVDGISFKAIGFAGTARGFSFPGLVKVGSGEALAHEEVGQIRYFFEGADHRLCREEKTYVALVRGSSSACNPVVSSVKSASFEYFVLREEPGSGGSWLTEWEGETSPLAVRLIIALEDGDGVEKQFTTTLP